MHRNKLLFHCVFILIMDLLCKSFQGTQSIGVLIFSNYK